MLKSILRTVRDGALKIFNVFPIQNSIIFESNPDFNDESYWICKKFISEGMDKKYKIYWYLKDHDFAKKPDNWDIYCIYSKPKNLKEWFQKQYVIHTAKCIFDSCDFVSKTRRKQFRMFLNHGGIAIKRAGSYFDRIGSYDYFSVATEYAKKHYMRIGFPENSLVVMGMARFDQLKKTGSFLRKMYQLDKETKIIIWMPTFRQHERRNRSKNIPHIPKELYGETGLPILKNKDDFLEINKKLKELNEFLVIKPHQSQNLQFLKIEELSNIKVLTIQKLNEYRVQLYEILSETDALLTDYSSIYVDYLLLQRPIGLTIDDLEIFEKYIGLTMNDYKNDIEGFYIESKENFVTFLEKLSEEADFMKQILKHSCEKFHKIKDFTCTEKLYNFIVEKAEL